MASIPTEPPDTSSDLSEDRRWRRAPWTARVIKNEDDDGWAVEMTRDGDGEPALVGPWTMGRDKKNPKPLDSFAFTVLVKTANDVLRRHEHQASARLHKVLAYTRSDGQRVRAALDIIPDEDDPHAVLGRFDGVTGEELRVARVEPGFRLSAAALERFLAGG